MNDFTSTYGKDWMCMGDFRHIFEWMYVWIIFQGTISEMHVCVKDILEPTPCTEAGTSTNSVSPNPSLWYPTT